MYAVVVHCGSIRQAAQILSMREVALNDPSMPGAPLALLLWMLHHCHVRSALHCPLELPCVHIALLMRCRRRLHGSPPVVSPTGSMIRGSGWRGRKQLCPPAASHRT